MVAADNVRACFLFRADGDVRVEEVIAVDAG